VVGISQALLGEAGKVALGLAVGLACLTTSIGLTATVAEYFSKLFKGRVGYKTICVITVVFSGIFATVGVTTIVRLAVPLLVTVYPVVIVLILLTMAGVRQKAVYTGAVVGALSTSIFEASAAAGFTITPVAELIARIPLASAGFPWILPAVVGGLVGMAVAATGRGGRVAEA
jgi:LIVCS family branched-chain amino acid:cation transporter